MNVLTLVTDAYGGNGGIAAVNRMVLRAIAGRADVETVHVLSRLHVNGVDPQPPGVEVDEQAAEGKVAYVRAALHAAQSSRWDLVLCGHLHLLPLAMTMSAPVVLVVHGIEAWRSGGDRLGTVSLAKAVCLRHLVARTRSVVAVSAFTLERFTEWAGPPRGDAVVVPNSIPDGRFSPGPKPAGLLARYGLEGRTVLLTLCRLASTEQYKGIDEVLAALPALQSHLPDIAYLVCGDGDDRPRLEARVRSLGLERFVTFAGYVPESEKADHYRLADAFVMPSRGEGFGIVYLEALASGLPVVAGDSDGSREALRDGRLGVLVDPRSESDLVRGIIEAVGRPNATPEGFDYFSEARFRQRWSEVVDRACST